MTRRRRGGLFARLEWERREEAPAAAPSAILAGITYPGGRGVDRSQVVNRLILGDNLAAMQALLPEMDGRIDLLYADPPFLSGKKYATRIGRGEDSRRPEGWQTAEGYTDTWPDGSDYLNMLLTRLRALYRLLKPTGTLYLHLDWHASAYGRLMLDEIFGPHRLLNEIVWVYHGPSPIRSAFKRKHDTILVYTKSDRYTFNADDVRVAYDPSTVRTFASSSQAGFGKIPDLERGKVPEDWWYFPVVARLHRERTGFPTQKPEALLERIVLASSLPGDTVGDFFCGSGTTAIVAARLGRRWLACDSARLAFHTSYRRILLDAQAPPFSVWMPPITGRGRNWEPVFQLTQHGRRAEVELTGVRGPTSTARQFPDNLDLWEVDWDFDGQCFRSRAQAVRPWRSEDLPLRLSFAFARSGNHSVRVRAANNQGEQGESEVTTHVR